MAVVTIKPQPTHFLNLVFNISLPLPIHPNMSAPPNENIVISLKPVLLFFTKLSYLFVFCHLSLKQLHISSIACPPPLLLLTLPFTNYLIIILITLLFVFLVVLVIPGFVPILTINWNLALTRVSFLATPLLITPFIVLTHKLTKFLSPVMLILQNMFFLITILILQFLV